MTTVSLVCMFVALVAFIVATFGIKIPGLSINWTAAGLALITLCWLLQHWTAAS